MLVLNGSCRWYIATSGLAADFELRKRQGTLKLCTLFRSYEHPRAGDSRQWRVLTEGNKEYKFVPSPKTQHK
eukprot:4611045-Amphidinium_carterae.1